MPSESGFGITVIVPVYRDVALTVACIRSAMPGVLAAGCANIVAINDDSPDMGMVNALNALVAEWPDHITVLHNPRNLGFVGTVNRGIRYCTTNDVVLLNSDVLLPDNWLERLVTDAYTSALVATVTPLSNNTTICTFPDFLQDNPLPFGMDTNQVDSVFRVGRLPCIESPTGVGFCMYIKRQAIEKVGLFDEERFGRGYGEENDFCQRVIGAGMLNVISPNLFAFHQGGVSFGAEKAQLIENATNVIADLHPRYHADVAEFIAQDPLRRARVHRMVQLIATTLKPCVLHVSHGIGGGVDQHIFELAQLISHQAVSLVLAPSRDGATVFLSLNATRYADRVSFEVDRIDDLIRLLKALGVSLVHYHHAMNLPLSYLDLAQRLGVPHLVTVHDYYFVNPCPTLGDKKGIYHATSHDAVINPLYPYPKETSPESWRERYRPLLDSARHVIFPTKATQDLYANFFVLSNGLVASHPEQSRSVKNNFMGIAQKSRYTVAAIGALGIEKGAELFEAVAKFSKSLGKPIDFVLIGYSHVHLAGICATGPYKPDELPTLLDRHGVDVIFFPVRIPETYSYTLSYALESGRAILAPNLGAFPERLSGRCGVALFDHLASVSQVAQTLDQLIKDCSQGVTPLAPGTEAQLQNPDFYTTEYLEHANEVKVISDPVFPADELVLAASGTDIMNASMFFRLVWRIYRHPAMWWLDAVVPYKVRRWVKRSLV